VYVEQSTNTRKTFENIWQVDMETSIKHLIVTNATRHFLQKTHCIITIRCCTVATGTSANTVVSAISGGPVFSTMIEKGRRSTAAVSSII